MHNPASRLPALLLVFCFTASPAAPELIVNAAAPGSNLPPAGASRFDQLFGTRDGAYRIPYPFERLIDYLEARVDNGTEAAVRQVFVPIGRSLQRDGPAPNYFRHPRRVVALEGEPVTGTNEAGQVMAYRLFIAHQPHSGTLEVISYNDDAARFEFQLVDDYRAGREPRVRQANRVMCLSCHHNAAPIFARNPWSETTFNVEVARRLAAALPEHYASLIDLVTLDAGFIDVLAERANYLAAAQFIWSRGCGSNACRLAMLRSALQYRLSGKSNFDRAAASYQGDYIAVLERSWSARWPLGLALPGSRISDRDPFTPGPRDARHDPLMLRPPQATWHDFDLALADGVIFRLGGFFTLADIRRLDQRLIQLADNDAVANQRWRVDCRATPVARAGLRLDCGSAEGPRGLRAALEIGSDRQRITGLRVESLKLPIDPDLWQPGIRAFTASDRRLEAVFGDRESGLSQRLANGDRLVSMTLDWADLPPAGGASLEIEVRREFQFMDAALERIYAGAGEPQPAGVGFNREAILRPLMRELGMPALDWGEAPAPAPRAAPPTPPGLSGDTVLLEPYCAHCHSGDAANPPAFLSANAKRGMLVECAPRMLARLEAWQPGHVIGRAPMPPPASIAYSGTNPASWPSSPHYRKLVSSLHELVTAEYGIDAALRWRQTNYERLPRCGASLSAE